MADIGINHLVKIIQCVRCNPEGLLDVTTREGVTYVATSVHGSGGVIRGPRTLTRVQRRLRGIDGLEPRDYIEVYLNEFENERVRIPIADVSEVKVNAYLGTEGS